MKVFISAAILLAVAFVTEAQLTEEQKAAGAKIVQECLAASKVDQAIVQKGRKADFTDDAKFKDYLVCIFKKNAVMNDAGVLQKDALKKLLTALSKDAPGSNQVIDKCAIQKTTPEVSAYEMAKCYFATVTNPVILF